jgi:hypothetical protein
MFNRVQSSSTTVASETWFIWAHDTQGLLSPTWHHPRLGRRRLSWALFCGYELISGSQQWWLHAVMAHL